MGPAEDTEGNCGFSCLTDNTQAHGLCEHNNASPQSHTADFTWISSMIASEHWVVGLCLYWKLSAVLSHSNSKLFSHIPRAFLMGVLGSPGGPAWSVWLIGPIQILIQPGQYFLWFSRHTYSLCNLSFNETTFSQLSGKHPTWSLSMFMCSQLE